MPLSALVLAGSRSGERDPVAAREVVAHKALAMLDGRTLLDRVAEALRGGGAERLLVCADDPAVVAEARRLGAEVVPPAHGPSVSAAAALALAGPPMLVTTADHALLRPEWVRQFLNDAPADCDAAVLLAPRRLVEEAAPGTRRTWLRFGDGDWSGCNLFLLRTPAAARAVALWREVERDRKRPWRIVRRFGAGVLLRYLLGRLTLSAAVRRLGDLAEVRAAAVAGRHGLAAVDVDSPADLDLVRRLVSEGRAA